MTLLQHTRTTGRPCWSSRSRPTRPSPVTRQVVQLVPDLTNSERESWASPPGRFVPPFAAFHHSNN